MELLEKYLKQININYDSEILRKFDIYYNLLIEWNEKFNLTNITEKNDVIIKHFADSLYGYPFVKDCKSIVDVGTGAGFPSIPLAIVLPNINFTLVDSLQKRVTFLNEIISQLGLTNVIAIHSRAEDFAKDNRHKYDIAVARAVSSMPTLLEYLVPLVKVDGKCVCYKSTNIDNELSVCSNAFSKLKCSLLERVDYNILDTDYSRSIVTIKVIDKCSLTYPRGKNKPKTNPL